MDTSIFQGGIPALMTPCNEDRTPNFDALVAKATELISAGMNGVVYCGSMGDWPLLTDSQRQEGVARLCDAGIPVIVGTGAQNPQIAAAHAAQLEAANIIDEYLNTFSFPSEESKKLSKVALLNYVGAAIIMPYKPFYEECIKQRYDVELLQNTFAVSFEQVAHRLTCLQNPKMKGIPFHMLRADVAGNISKRFSLSGIEIPRYGGACPRWNIYKAFTMPGKINAAVSKMSNGEKYVCIARTVEKGIGKHGMEKTLLSIGLGCQVKFAKDFVYADSLNLNDKKSETPIGVNCRTCDRMDCQQRAFPPLHKKFDIDLNKRGISVYVAD